MDEKQVILVVDDDKEIVRVLGKLLELEGYEVYAAGDGIEALEIVTGRKVHLILLDVNLPGRSGFELCKWLKARVSVPVLILTARDTLADELYALGLGADDFLTKPCHPKRLAARAERILKTYQEMRNLVRAGDVMLDVDTGRVIWGKQSVTLPETEWRILKLLMERYPSVAGKQEIVDALWGGGEYVDENILQVNMARLRKNLDSIGLKHLVKTVRGSGYCLEVTGL